jgi:predicted RNase H-like nuclease (RuvC/YqgF family)
MADVVIVALITGGCSVLGVILTNLASNRKVEQQIEKAQAVTDVKIEQLTDEVRKHNSFGDRITRLEEQTRELTNRIERMDVKISRLHHGE